MALAAAKTEAYPILQLDIVDGRYDAATQTIVSGGPDFTLIALLTPKTNTSAATLASLLNDTYYISAAVTPQTGSTHNPLGSFTWNSSNYMVTGDMTYGTPPLEIFDATPDPGDLAPHGIYPTFFKEFSFSFSPTNTAVKYDTAANPGGYTPTSATTNVSYFATFNLTTALIGDNALHFDLYNSIVKRCGSQRPCVYDEDIGYFAPFSHDAESTPARVSEPQSMALMAVGLFFAGRVLRRRQPKL
jgi:hypothetical protein